MFHGKNINRDITMYIFDFGENSLIFILLRVELEQTNKLWRNFEVH